MKQDWSTRTREVRLKIEIVLEPACVQRPLSDEQACLILEGLLKRSGAILIEDLVDAMGIAGMPCTIKTLEVEGCEETQKPGALT